MKIKALDQTLTKLAELIRQDRFEELETDTLEIKPVPADKNGWHERHKSACAFLNTRGGMLLLGIEESVSTNKKRRYELKGWKAHAEPNIKDFHTQFTDQDGNSLDLISAFPPPTLIDFMGGQVAVILIDELPSDQKFVFYNGKAYKRLVTGDHVISDSEIEQQEEFKEEAQHARELLPVANFSLENFDLEQLNDYINRLNRPIKIESLKPDLESARAFLERKYFLKSGQATTLGVLVCGKHPVDYLGFRCQVHGYVDVPQEIARDKQDVVDNILPLMERSLAYVIRNIQVGVSAKKGGENKPQYPEELIRETVNNALAHRDYTIDRQVIIAIKPDAHISINNPGTFRKHLLIECPNDQTQLRRILPEARPRNPKLADVLRVYRKWEGRGIGMATLVNMCLQDDIDLPYYILKRDEVTLYLESGRLLDDQMETLFDTFSNYLENKLNGNKLTKEQKLVLSYLIKSEWANKLVRYTIMLTPDNNHFRELGALETAGLIYKHSSSTSIYPVYVVDGTLLVNDYNTELRQLFGIRFDALEPLLKDILNVVYRQNNFSKTKYAMAKQTSFSLWYRKEKNEDIKAFNSLYRKVRAAFVKLNASGYIIRRKDSKGYMLNLAGGDGTLKYQDNSN